MISRSNKLKLLTMKAPYPMTLSDTGLHGHNLLCNAMKSSEKKICSAKINAVEYPICKGNVPKQAAEIICYIYRSDIRNDKDGINMNICRCIYIYIYIYVCIYYMYI